MKTLPLRQLLIAARNALLGVNQLDGLSVEELAVQLCNCDSPDVHPLVGESFPVLDGGFVKLVRLMGGDASIVEAARLTAQSEGREIGDDRSLLRYLMRHSHSTPTEFFEIVLHVRCTMDVWRQWVRFQFN